MRTVIYWLGWIMATVAYLVLITDVLLTWLFPEHNSLLVRIFLDRGPAALGVLTWAAIAALCLTVEE